MAALPRPIMRVARSLMAVVLLVSLVGVPRRRSILLSLVRTRISHRLRVVWSDLQSRSMSRLRALVVLRVCQSRWVLDPVVLPVCLPVECLRCRASVVAGPIRLKVAVAVVKADLKRPRLTA